MTAAPRTLREALLRQACGVRCGLVNPAALSEPTLADLPGFFNAVVPIDGGSPGEASSGGMGRTPEEALDAAIGEALERYSAVSCALPLRRRSELSGKAVLPSRAFGLFSAGQHAAPGFPWPAPDERAETYAPVFSLAHNEEVWVPQELVGLGSRVDPPRLPSTSTGLAAYTDPFTALLRGLEEVLERDALSVSWLNGLPGRELELPPAYAEPVAARGGEALAYDLTQAWNPHPVVAVCGHVPLRGWKRISFGVACRATYEEAIESAYREWFQGVLFVGYHVNEHPGLRFGRASEVRDFVHHGVYYAIEQGAWREVPLLRRGVRAVPAPLASPGTSSPPVDAVRRLQAALSGERIRVYYRDLSPPDVARLGVTVVRVLSPDLSLLHADERTPFLGGRIRDVAWRYPGLRPAIDVFPSPYPHPLG